MINLSQDDVKFMLKTLQLTPALHRLLQAMQDGGDISEDKADELRDCCTDCLDEVGFDENYELTDDGAVLEVLVDKLFTG